MGESEVMEGK